MVQDPTPYATDILQVYLQITHDLKPTDSRNGGKNRSPTGQTNAGIVPDFRTGVSEGGLQALSLR